MDESFKNVHLGHATVVLFDGVSSELPDHISPLLEICGEESCEAVLAETALIAALSITASGGLIPQD